jgi:hypothetical protein
MSQKAAGFHSRPGAGRRWPVGALHRHPQKSLREIVEAVYTSRDRFIHFHTFEAEGVAEAEFEADVRRFFYAWSGDAPAEAWPSDKWADDPVLLRVPDPDPLPAWLTEADIDYYVSELEQSGFRDRSGFATLSLMAFELPQNGVVALWETETRHQPLHRPPSGSMTDQLSEFAHPPGSSGKRLGDPRKQVGKGLTLASTVAASPPTQLDAERDGYPLDRQILQVPHIPAVARRR